MPVQVRVHQIVIDTPRTESDPFISLMVQKKFINDEGEVTQTINRERQLYRQVSKTAAETIEFFDPVTQQSHVVSVAGIGMALESIVAKWLAEDHDSIVDENGKVWVD